jgi:hypothetical protein
MIKVLIYYSSLTGHITGIKSNIDNHTLSLFSDENKAGLSGFGFFLLVIVQLSSMPA